ncbi:hypothetical protein ACVMYR_02940 [Micromonospora sp. PTRAS2]
MEDHELVDDEVWHEGEAADARLADLGLTRQDIDRALYGASADALLCTDLDAAGAKGFIFWSRANRYLREEVLPRGWSWTNRDAVLRAIHPDGSFAITALSGSGQVGVARGRGVQTKNPKGSSIAQLVRFNRSVLGGPRNAEPIPLWDDAGDAFEPGMIPTWILLYKWTVLGIVSELSLPTDMLGKTVNRWKEHILLGPVTPPGGSGIEVDLDMPDGPDDDVDVFVERIAS